jgi:ligand-binding sensor domain-containing protein
MAEVSRREQTRINGSRRSPAAEPRVVATRRFSRVAPISGLLLGLVFPVQRASAFEPTKPIAYSHSSWSTDAGLPQSTAQSIAQTPDGYLWIATLEGLARFDGSRFTVFDQQSTPPLPDKDVQALYVTKDGTLWAGFYAGGLVAYRGGAFYTYGQQEGLSSVQIVALAEDTAGNLWLGTSGAGVYRYSGGRFESFTTREGLASGVVNTILSDGAGGVWIGSVGGLDRFIDGHIRHYSRDRSHELSVTALASDGHALAVGTPEGLFRVQGEHVVLDDRTRGISQPNVQALLFDRAGILWVGTEDGLNSIRDRAVTHLDVRDGLSDNGVLSLFEDAEGSLWVGTLEGGLNRLRRGPITAYTSAQGLSSSSVQSVLPARSGGLWLGEVTTVDFLSGAGVRPLGGPEDLGHSSVQALVEDRHGRLWAGNAVGLHCFEGGRWSHYSSRDGLAQGAIRVLLEDHTGRLWIGTDGGGLAFLENGRFGVLTTRDGLLGNRIRALVEDDHGTLWIGTYGGVSALSKGHFTNYTTREGLSHNLVHNFLLDPDGTLWIGTFGGGLNQLKNGRLTALTTRQGLFQDVVYSVVDDGLGRLWMISNKGIFFLKRTDFEEYAAGRLARVNCVTYGLSDGMPSVEGQGGAPAGAPAGARGADGRLYFPTPKGLVAIDPSFPPAEHQVRPPIVEGAWLNGQSVPFQGRLEAPPGKNRLLFHYTSVALSYAARLTFSYRLEGFEADWVDGGVVRQTQYTNLPPGDYRFLVRAREGEGPWSRPGSAIVLHVPAVWYRTPTFEILVLAGLLASAGAVVQLRIRRLRAHEVQLARGIEEALGEVRMLSGLLPICANCKKIRDDGGAWHQIESYVREHSEATFTHGICPTCLETLHPEAARRIKERKANQPLG